MPQFLCVLLLLSSTQVKAEARDQLRRDVEGYASATCLTLQEEDYLRQQGQGWASIIIQRGYGDIGHWLPLIESVRAQLKEEPVSMIIGDGPAAKPVPIFHCAEIIDKPRVRAAIEAAITRFKPDYEGHQD
jgi:hypothetical protein